MCYTHQPAPPLTRRPLLRRAPPPARRVHSFSHTIPKQLTVRLVPSLPHPLPPSTRTRQAGVNHEARILDVKRAADGAPMYKVHYKGWNKKWDEWVEPKRILKDTRQGLTLVHFFSST